MASDKKRRKAAKAKQKPGPTAGPFRHPDGDRRHRGKGMTYRDVMKQKELIQRLGAIEPPPEPKGDDEKKKV